MAEDYYELLGVSRDASRSEIKQAYRDRIKETHPDVSDDREASERTKQLIEARDVLTDQTTRKRYDRLGHEQFVRGMADDKQAQSDTQGSHGATGDGTRTSAGQAADGTRTSSGHAADGPGESRRDSNGRRGRSRQQQASGDNVGPSWSQSGAGPTDGQAAHSTWSSDRSYVVDEGPGMFELRHLFESQQTIVLLGTTFVIYPILLAGALFPAFPAAANLTVGLCVIMVIAYLQSIPQVGIFVFGTWSVLLPIGLFAVARVDPLTLSSLLAVAAVLFPFGLSMMSWMAINPNRRF